MIQFVTAHEINMLLFPETMKFVESHPIDIMAVTIALIIIIIGYGKHIFSMN